MWAYIYIYIYTRLRSWPKATDNFEWVSSNEYVRKETILVLHSVVIAILQRWGLVVLETLAGLRLSKVGTSGQGWAEFCMIQVWSIFVWRYWLKRRFCRFRVWSILRDIGWNVVGSKWFWMWLILVEFDSFELKWVGLYWFGFILVDLSRFGLSFVWLIFNVFEWCRLVSIDVSWT